MRIFGDIIRQELQGDKAAQFDILSLLTHTHPATAELLDDAVVRDGLPDHGCWSIMLGVKVEQVNAKLGKCMATAKGTPVPSEMTPMYSGVKSRARERASYLSIEIAIRH